MELSIYCFFWLTPSNEIPANELNRRLTVCSHPFTVKCLNCKAVSDTFDPYLDVALEVKVTAHHLMLQSMR